MAHASLGTFSRVPRTALQYTLSAVYSTGRSPGASRESELAAKCKQQRDEWIDMMFKPFEPRIASTPRVAAPPQVPDGPPEPKKKKGKK